MHALPYLNESPSTNRSLNLAKDVVLARQDGTARLVDLNRGRFFALDVVGAQLVQHALEVCPAEAVRNVAARFQVPEPLVQADWETLLDGLKDKRLLVGRRGPCVGRMAGSLKIVWLLTLAWIGVRLLGWTGAVRFFRRLGGTQPQRHTQDARAAVDTVDHGVRYAAAMHPFNTQCKERALVCWHLLRTRYGLPAEMVVGITFFPFQAHVWVQCGSWIVSDDASRCEEFTPVAKFL